MIAERAVQSEVLRAIGAAPGVRLFRNSVGVGWTGNLVERSGSCVVLNPARRVTFGLHPGSPDLIGWRSFVVGPEHVGTTIAQFVGIENKRPSGGRLEATQGPFLEALAQAGALCGVCRGADDARLMLAVAAHGMRVVT